MRYKLILLACFSFLSSVSFSQNANDISIALHTDLIRSNNHGYFERFQTSLEGNYFLSEKFSGTGGLEYWTEGKQWSLVVGARWYPIPDAFIRVRGLIGSNDFSLGGGWVKPLNESWRFEAIGDVYSNANIAIRAGFTYLIGR